MKRKDCNLRKIMEERKAVEDVEEKEVLSEDMIFIYADSASVR